MKHIISDLAAKVSFPNISTYISNLCKLMLLRHYQQLGLKLVDGKLLQAWGLMVCLSRSQTKVACRPFQSDWN